MEIIFSARVLPLTVMKMFGQSGNMFDDDDIEDEGDVEVLQVRCDCSQLSCSPWRYALYMLIYFFCFVSF